MVIRVSGNQDPMNDSDAVVEIGYSPDKIVKDARGGVAMDYSYRIVKSEPIYRLKATIRNGVVETEQVDICTCRASPGSTIRPATPISARASCAEFVRRPPGRPDRRLSQLARSLRREHLCPGRRPAGRARA